MKAIIVKQPGGADQLQITDQPTPVPQPNELLIKVMATAINRSDIINRQKDLGYLTSPILGVEVAGTVVKAGPNSKIPVGARVMGLVNGGGYAEYVVMPADRAMIIPDQLSFTEAAAIPEVFLTAYQTLFWLGKLKDHETVLIHAGGSGVGTAAIQLAKQLSHANVITTAGSAQKLAVAQSLGADHGINYHEQDFDKEVLNITDNAGVDLILDFVGASYWQPNLTSIKVDGRWVLIGILGGTKVKDVNLMELMQKRIQLTGTLLTPRSDEYKAELTQEFIANTAELFNNQKLRPIFDKVFAFDEIQQAHEYMESNQNIGKIILQVAK